MATMPMPADPVVSDPVTDPVDPRDATDGRSRWPR